VVIGMSRYATELNPGSSQEEVVTADPFSMITTFVVEEPVGGLVYEILSPGQPGNVYP